MSRQGWDRALHDGRIRLNGRIVKKGGAEVPAGTEISVDLPPLGLQVGETAPPLVWASPARDLAVFNKPPGIDTYPLFPWENGTLANGLARFVEQEGWMKPTEFAALSAPPILEGGLLQRLDRDTSGLVCSAFTPAAKLKYRQAFSGAAKKGYLALVDGNFSRGAGPHRIYFGGGDQARVRTELSEKPGYQAAELTVRVLAEGAAATLVEVETSQGLRHVVRAGLAALGSPLVGDALYEGSGAAPFHQLHAHRILLPGFDQFYVAPPESFLGYAAGLGVNYSP
ncbi:MAG: RNA pseudouridine synthase [Proteobacteria bacterium]|nr:MAG: RNA pseudouridine synthase [Pseudomonadota bacterium]